MYEFSSKSLESNSRVGVLFNLWPLCFPNVPLPLLSKWWYIYFQKRSKSECIFLLDKYCLYNQADYFVSLRKTSSTILLHHLKSFNALQNRDPSISLTSFAKFNFVYYHIKGPLANEIFAEHKHFKKSTKKYELPPLYYKL